MLIALALGVGIVLGAFLYSRFGGTTPSPHPSNAAAAESDKPADAEAPSDVVQISPESQKEVGIAVEPAAVRSLQGSLSATGVVSEDPARVAHIRTLARGLIEKIYARLGDRVSAGDRLVEYDNIELGLAIGEYLSAQAELQRSLTDLEVKTKILERSREMLQVGAVAQTTHDLREAEVKDAEAKVAGARATVSKIAEQIRRFGWTDGDLAKLAVRAGGFRPYRVSQHIESAFFRRRHESTTPLEARSWSRERSCSRSPTCHPFGFWRMCMRRTSLEFEPARQFGCEWRPIRGKTFAGKNHLCG